MSEVRHETAPFDHFAHRSMAESDRAWKDLRQQCPVAWTEANGGYWIAAGYEEVAAAFRDWESFSSARSDPERTSLSIGGSKMRVLYPEELDPPEWNPMRRVLGRMLAPQSVERLRPRVEYWVAHAIDQVIERGSCDLSDDLTCRVPESVALEMLGFDRSDWTRISGAFHHMASYANGTPEFVAAGAELEWVAELVHLELTGRLDAPRDDAMTAIVHHEIDGERIPLEAAEAITRLTVGGGVDTSTSVSSAALLHLARHPEDRRRLLDDPTLIDGAVEEFLRVYPPARTHSRIVARDVEFAGCQMHKGERILLSEVSANHDEAEFPEPDRFLIDRFPNRHISFGMGLHRCPGSHLARLELKTILVQVLKRLPDFVVDEAGVVEYPNWSMIGGWGKIPATFTPGLRIVS
jgi:cytochrome P450